MGQYELEAALRREGDEQVREIWQQVEEQAESLRRENAALLDRQQQAEQVRREATIADILDTAQAGARQNAQRKRLRTEDGLVERLKQLAGPVIESMAEEGGPELFTALADEVPAHDWYKVLINPRDAALARSRFPEAEIVTTEQISGGLKVENREGRIVIINSLEKRLEHLWSELLPEVFSELRQRVGE